MSIQKSRKTAVMYGAGNIGRGFIGQIFHDSGYEVIFIDINRDVVTSLNNRNSYTQLIIDADTVERREINAVRAVDGNNREAVARVIADCGIMAVSVGAAVLQHIAPVIADGLSIRKQPLNILVCENLVHAPAILREYICTHLSEASKPDRIGFVGATIGRMVPVMPPQQRSNDPTLIAVERFCTLPLDADAIVQPMPELKNTILCSPFAFEEGKKLYIHNMGHALTAYLGFLKNYTFIWQAVEDNDIRGKAHDAMMAVAEALARKYNEDRIGLAGYVYDLLTRFGNKGLGDSIARVGGDPLRKLAPGDRLMGAIDLCREQSTDYSPILSAVAAALSFDVSDDPSSNQLRKRLNKEGASAFLRDYCDLSEKDITILTLE